MNRQCQQGLTDEQVEQYRQQVDGFLKYQNLERNEIVISVELLEEVILTLEHARKFITNKWITMHPDGLALYDECVEKLKAAHNIGV